MSEPMNTTEEMGSGMKFRNRKLGDPSQVFEHNAWDDVEPDEEHYERAKVVVAIQAETKVDEEMRDKYNKEANEYWNKFYGLNENRFFKDRNWLKTEFPELFENTTKQAIKENELFTVMEIGCGTGATAYPLLEANPDPNLRVIACDFSQVAVDLVKNNPKFDEKRLTTFAWDMTSSTIPTQVNANSVDVITLIFAFSAVDPSTWSQVISNLNLMLKPGGHILFRDYGQYDMAQLRFKKGRYLDDNFYVRGDGTQVYFFKQDELNQIFTPTFNIVKNEVDRRLIVNRHRQLKMFRVWLQAKMVKPHLS